MTKTTGKLRSICVIRKKIALKHGLKQNTAHRKKRSGYETSTTIRGVFFMMTYFQELVAS